MSITLVDHIVGLLKSFFTLPLMDPMSLEEGLLDKRVAKLF